MFECSARPAENEQLSESKGLAGPTLRDAVEIQSLETIEARKFKPKCVDMPYSSFRREMTNMSALAVGERGATSGLPTAAHSRATVNGD